MGHENEMVIHHQNVAFEVESKGKEKNEKI